MLATGARPRSLPFAAPEGVHTLRTLADARALRASLVAGARLAVVGGGFIGAEVASTAVALGLDVTLIEALRVPFERTLGADVGQLLAKRYRSYGVELRLATGVVGFTAGADGGVRAARLTDGTEVPCDLALVGIGIEPARELLPHPLAGYPIYPCGDVTGSGGHWTSAAAQGTAVARRILGLPIEPPKPAFFWSDQFGLRLQLVGATSPTGTVSFDGRPDSYVARYHDGEGRLLGALAANRPAAVAPLRRELEQPPQIAALSRPRSLPRFNAWRVSADPTPRTRARWQSSPIKQSHCEDQWLPAPAVRKYAASRAAEQARIDEEIAGRVTIAR